jgi:hypothetical protein
MTMGWPNSSASLGATKRAMLSIKPPGGKGTTSLMGGRARLAQKRRRGQKGGDGQQAAAAAIQFLRCMGGS